jgi:opacity protein-like surface antigen
MRFTLLVLCLKGSFLYLCLLPHIPFEMKKGLRYLLFFIAFLISTQVVEAQQRRYKGGYSQRRSVRKFISPGNIFRSERNSIYGGLGFTTYYGDLCDSWDCMTLRPAVGLGFQHRTDALNTRLSYRFEFNYFRLGVKHDTYPTRMLDFRSGNVEMFVAAVYDLYPYEKHFRRRPLASPYFFAGIGFATINPHGSLNGQWYALKPLHTEGVNYSSVTPTIPFGAGVRLKYTYNAEFVFEGGYRFTFTDHLDDVSSTYYKSQASFSDPIAAQLSKKSAPSQIIRGNPHQNDGYFMFNVRFRWTFGKPQMAKFRGKSHILRKR